MAVGAADLQPPVEVGVDQREQLLAERGAWVGGGVDAGLLRRFSTTCWVGATPMSAVSRVSSIDSQVSSSSLSRERRASRPRPSPPWEPASRCRSRVSRDAVLSGFSSAGASDAAAVGASTSVGASAGASVGVGAMTSVPVRGAGTFRRRPPTSRPTTSTAPRTAMPMIRYSRSPMRAIQADGSGDQLARSYPSSGSSRSPSWASALVIGLRHGVSQPRGPGDLLASVRERDVGHDESGESEDDDHGDREHQHGGSFPSRCLKSRTHGGLPPKPGGDPAAPGRPPTCAPPPSRPVTYLQFTCGSSAIQERHCPPTWRTTTAPIPA